MAYNECDFFGTIWYRSDFRGAVSIQAGLVINVLHLSVGVPAIILLPDRIIRYQTY